MGQNAAVMTGFDIDVRRDDIVRQQHAAEMAGYRPGGAERRFRFGAVSRRRFLGQLRRYIQAGTRQNRGDRPPGRHPDGRAEIGAPECDAIQPQHRQAAAGHLSRSAHGQVRAIGRDGIDSGHTVAGQPQLRRHLERRPSGFVPGQGSDRYDRPCQIRFQRHLGIPRSALAPDRRHGHLAGQQGAGVEPHGGELAGRRFAGDGDALDHVLRLAGLEIHRPVDRRGDAAQQTVAFQRHLVLVRDDIQLGFVEIAAGGDAGQMRLPQMGGDADIDVLHRHLVFQRQLHLQRHGRVARRFPQVHGVFAEQPQTRVFQKGDEIRQGPIGLQSDLGILILCRQAGQAQRAARDRDRGACADPLLAARDRYVDGVGVHDLQMGMPLLDRRNRAEPVSRHVIGVDGAGRARQCQVGEIAVGLQRQVQMGVVRDAVGDVFSHPRARPAADADGP